MAGPAGVSVKLVRVWAALMQISGGFTYSLVADVLKKGFRPRVQVGEATPPGISWLENYSSKGKISAGKYQDFCNDPKKQYFIFWSYFLIPLYFILFVLNVIVSVDEIYTGFKATDSTVSKTTAIVNLYRPTTLLILFLHVIFSSEKLSCLLSQLNLVTPDSVTPTKWWSYKLFFVGLVTFCSCEAYVVISLFDSGDANSTMVSKGYFKTYSTGLANLVNSFISFDFAFGYYSVGCHLAVLISDLRNKIEDQICFGGSCEKDVTKKKVEITFVKVNGKYEDGDQFRKRAADLAAITSNIQELHTCQELTNEYFSPPLLGIFTQTMIYMTVSFFSATVEGLMHVLIDFIFWFSFNTSLLIFLCCTPDFASSQLDELRFSANQWRMKVSDPILETKLTYLLDLVDNFPPFSIGRFFVAAKARLIDIASFIATYLIILLQFRAGESVDKGNNSTSNAGLDNASLFSNDS